MFASLFVRCFVGWIGFVGWVDVCGGFVCLIATGLV